MAQNDSDPAPAVPSASSPLPPRTGAAPTSEHAFSSTILNIGFIFALLLAGACLAGATFYMYSFFSSTTQKIDSLLGKAGQPGVTEVLLQLGINAALVSARLALLSCGVFIGMAFGFLGFALFLIGIKGEIEASGTHESFSFKIARISPGAFVITCTMVLIAICVTHRTPFDYKYETPAAPAGGGEKTAASILKKLAAPDTTAPAPQPSTAGIEDPAKAAPVAPSQTAAPGKKHAGTAVVTPPTVARSAESPEAEHRAGDGSVWR